MRGFQPLGQLLPSALRRANIEPVVSASQTLRQYRQLVERELGASIARTIQPRTITQGTLIVGVPSSSLITELRLYETVWLSALRNTSAPNVSVERIRYELESFPTQ
jgi:predicted nucleic acid-binding Zn ribbon protein